MNRAILTINKLKLDFGRLLMLAALLVLAAALAGCAQSAGGKPSPGEYGYVSNPGKFPVTVIDGTGREVTIEKEPRTIASMQASYTEISFAVGLGDKIVGVSNFCNYPEAALTKEKLGGRNMDVEKILTMLPDLIFVTDFHHSNHSAILDQYRAAGIQVIVVNSATSFEHAYTTMRLIAGATGASGEAERIIKDMKDRMGKLAKQAEKAKTPAKVWVEVAPAPDISTTGSGTFMHEMLETLGAVNVAGGQEGWLKYTEEQAVALAPDVIITTYGFYVENALEGVMKRPGWAAVPAIVNKRVYDVDSDIVTRPGPRLVEGVELLAKAIYPDIFN